MSVLTKLDATDVRVNKFTSELSQKAGELAGQAATEAGLPENTVELAKATAIGTVAAMRTIKDR